MIKIFLWFLGVVYKVKGKAYVPAHACLSILSLSLSFSLRMPLA
jgi:hypothetical protein